MQLQIHKVMRIDIFQSINGYSLFFVFNFLGKISHFFFSFFFFLICLQYGGV